MFIVQFFVDQNHKVYIIYIFDASDCSVRSRAGFIKLQVYNLLDLGNLYISQCGVDEFLKEPVSFMEQKRTCSTDPKLSWVSTDKICYLAAILEEYESRHLFIKEGLVVRRIVNFLKQGRPDVQL